MRVTLALLSCTKKYNLLEAFLRISLIWVFQVKSLEIFRPNNFTLSTTSNASPLMRMGSNSGWDFVKDIGISLHLSVFSWTLFSSDHRTTLSAVRWALISWFGYMSYPRRRVSRTSFCTFVTFILPLVISLLHFLNVDYSERKGASKKTWSISALSSCLLPLI